jgi:prepilin-type N-terminal cleavage/methylation domain-containing protein
MRHARPSRAAFTLVELLVVIAIIALLVAILFPALSKARVLSNRVKCSSNQRQLAAAVLMYANDFDGKLPFCNCLRLETIRQLLSKGYRHDGWLYSADAGSQLPEHVEQGGLWKYLRTQGVYRCPADEEPFEGGNLLSSYRMNHTVAPGYTSAYGLDYHTKLAQFRGDALLFWEIATPTPFQAGVPIQLGADAHPGNGITARHGSVAPVACFDGHVETMTADEFAAEAARDPGRLRAPPAVTWD